MSDLDAAAERVANKAASYCKGAELGWDRQVYERAQRAAREELERLWSVVELERARLEAARTNAELDRPTARERALKAAHHVMEALKAHPHSVGGVAILIEEHAGLLALEQSEVKYEDLMALKRQVDDQLEAAVNGIEDLVRDEVISAGRAREIHGYSIERQRELWRRRARGSR